VTEVLKGVETSRPVLSVGDFSLHDGSAAKSDDSDDDNAAADGGAIAVTLDVYGYRAG
jgi:hypothetical protein